MYNRNLASSSSRLVHCTGALSIFSAAPLHLQDVKSYSTSRRWLAFESRGSKFHQQQQQQQSAAQPSGQSVFTNTPKPGQQQQQQHSQAQQQNYASGKFSATVRDWTRMKTAAVQNPGAIVSGSLRREFLNSFDVFLFTENVFSEVPMDAAFATTLLDTAAAILPSPFAGVIPSAYHQLDKGVEQAVAAALPPNVHKILRVVADWSATRRQQAGDSNPGASVDNVVLLYAVQRLGASHLLLPHDGNKHAQQQQQQQQRQNSSLNTAAVTPAHVMVNPKELRLLPPESLSLAMLASALMLGKASCGVAEACSLRLVPVLRTMKLSALAQVAAVVFDPALTAACGGDRTVVALRTALASALAKEAPAEVAAKQPAVVASILASLLRDPTAIEPAAQVDVIRRFSETFALSCSASSALVSPRCVLEVLRAFADNSDKEDFVLSRIATDVAADLVKALSSVVELMEKQLLQVGQQDGAVAASPDLVFCLFELYRFLSLPSVAHVLNRHSSAAESVVDKIRAMSCDLAPQVSQLLQAPADDAANAEPASERVNRAWCLAVPLMNALAQDVAVLGVATGGNASASSIPDGTAASPPNSDAPLRQDSLLNAMSSSFLTALSETFAAAPSSSSSLSSSSPIDFADPRFPRRLSALLTVRGFLSRKEVQNLVTGFAKMPQFSSSLPDVCVIVEALGRAINFINADSPDADRMANDARQLARSLAPVAAVAGASVADIVRLAHAYGVLRVRDESLCQAMIGRVCAQRDELSAEEVAAFLFSLARMDERSSKPYTDLVLRVKVITPTASAAAATAILVSYARAAVVWNYAAFFRLCERIVEMQATWSRHDMLPLLVALLRVDLRHERLIEVVTKEVIATVSRMIEQRKKTTDEGSGNSSGNSNHATADQNSSKLTTGFPAATAFSSSWGAAASGGGCDASSFTISAATVASASSDAAAPFTLDECVRLLACLTRIDPQTAALEVLGTFFVQRQSELSAIQLGDVLAALGRCSPLDRARPFFDQLVIRATALLPQAPPVALATIASGFAALNSPHPEVFSLVSTRALRLKEECPALVIAQILTCFAAVGIRDDRLFVEMIPRVRYVAHHGSAQDVANVLTAYTTVQLWHYKLFVRLAERAIAVRADARPHQIAQIVAAFAKVEMRYDKLFVELSPRIQIVSCSASASDVATLVASYASMNLYDAPVFSTLADRALQIVSQFTPEEAHRILAAFDKMSVTHEQLKKALGKTAERHEEALILQRQKQKEEELQQQQQQQRGSQAGQLDDEEDAEADSEKFA